MKILNEAKRKKLTQEVQGYITSLENKVRELHEQNQAIMGTINESNTYYQLWLNRDYTKHYLPESTNLTVIGKETKVSMFVDHEGQIRIDIGYGLIMPQARNSIYIVPERSD